MLQDSWELFLLSGSLLAEVRRKALRGGYWFRVLDRVERGIFELASRLFEVVHSGTLLEQLVLIIAKLRAVAKSSFVKHFEAHGIDRILQVYEQAKRLGYGSLDGLMNEGFMRYLMFLDFNQPIGWSLHLRSRGT
jgi:hypothetical protein